MWAVLRAKAAMPWRVSLGSGASSPGAPSAAVAASMGQAAEAEGVWERLTLPPSHRVRSPGVPPQARLLLAQLRAGVGKYTAS